MDISYGMIVSVVIEREEGGGGGGGEVGCFCVLVLAFDGI